ncbi:hypothetical protein OIV83_002048 [Microbotryomycetes sp. JL201]|nr:hypothetical protein OIV83_002048 [Microbotryomycetes sp. JL201]
MDDELTLKSILAAGGVLVGVDEPPNKIRHRPTSLGAVLARRLEAASKIQPAIVPRLASQDAPEHLCKVATAAAARQALESLVRRVSSDQAAQHARTPTASTSKAPPPPPLFSIKDTKVIGMLAGIVARWGVGLALDKAVLPPQFTPSPASHAKIQKVSCDDVDEEDSTLAEIVSFLLSLVSRSGDRTDGHRQLAAIAAPQITPLLLAGMCQLAHHEPEPGISWQERLDAFTSSPAWFKTTVAKLLSKQIWRPGGVRSLLLIVVGTGSASGGEDEVGVKKLDMLYKLLASPAPDSNTVPNIIIISQLYDIVRSAVTSALAPPKRDASRLPPPPPTILRAACFVLSHMLLSPSSTDSCHKAFLDRLHDTFMPATSDSLVSEHDADAIEPPLSPSQAILETLTTLSTLFLYSPPLPGLQTLLIGPILPALASLGMFVGFDSQEDKKETLPQSRIIVVDRDPRFGDETRALLQTWAKSADRMVVILRIRQLVDDIEGDKQFGLLDEGARAVLEWSWDDQGGICIRKRLVSRETTDMPIDAIQMVKWLELVDRKDVSGALFVRWLDELQVLRKQSGFEAAKKAVVRLQLVLQMVEMLGSDILTEPEQIISFVAHALDAGHAEVPDKEATEVKTAQPFGLGSLKIVDDDENVKDLAQADEEEAIIPGIGTDEMATTALTLLLAVLEGHEHLDMASTPTLVTVYNKLDTFASSESELLPPLAREAKLVLSSRRASRLASQPPSSADGSLMNDPLAQSRSTYQEALKFLQDPLLPVRAQGLAMLKSLVSSKQAFLSTDPALLPAVLDIFVQALQDDDSFLYLNAIQGLSGMADVFGKQVVKRLVAVYTGGTSDSSKRSVGTGDRGRRELDKRLRMGEALVQVVRRAGKALAVIVDDLVPQLLFVMRTASLPVPLRSSSLTILATAIETDSIALLPFAETLTEACLTLLSIESQPLVPKLSRTDLPTSPEAAPNTTRENGDEEDVDDEFKIDVANLLSRDQLHSNDPRRQDRTGSRQNKIEETDDAVETLDAKRHPSLRRSAILFLGLLFRTVSEQVSQDEGRSGDAMTLGRIRVPGVTNGSVPRSRGSKAVAFETIARARTVLRYVNETDRDELVRYQAGQVLQELDE